MALTYQGEALKKRVAPLAEQIGCTAVLPCDVTDEASLDAVFATLEEQWGRLDFVVHAIAYSDKEQLKGRYVETTAENFGATMLISCYSFTAVCQRAERLMTAGGSLLTLTYMGAERVMPHYNVMGVAKAALEASVRYLAEDLGRQSIRVNALSAGPIKTLAASGIGDFRYILKWNQYNAPLRRNVTLDEVGGAGLYLLSDLSTGVTGEMPLRRLRLQRRRHAGRRRRRADPRDAGALRSQPPRCRVTASARCSASPASARATDRRSAASSTACRRACRWPRPTSRSGSTAGGPASRASPPSAASRTGCRSSPACSRD